MQINILIFFFQEKKDANLRAFLREIPRFEWVVWFHNYFLNVNLAQRTSGVSVAL